MCFNAYVALDLVSKSKGFETGFWTIEFMKNRILVVLSLRGYLGLSASEKRSASSRT